jgi:arylsulfatase A-like enzyme
MITRREMFAASAGAWAAQQPAATPTRRPNVLLIMTDDQGYGDLSCHGNPHLKTPNLDRLAGEGVEFTRFTVSPVCAPTRASLLTGRYHLRCGVHGVTGGRETIRGEEITLGGALKESGYVTGLIGKWHLGENYPYVPHAMGFDKFVGFRTGHWNRYFDSPAEERGLSVRLSGYITDALTDEAIRFLRLGGDAPFFLYVAYNAPHAPYQLPQNLFEKYRRMNLPPETAAVYGMVENLDTNVGRLLSELKQLKMDDNTIVVFLTDNGPQTDRFNSGLRGRKASVYEGGTRVPFFIHAPGKTTPGRKVDRVAAHIDLFPTLLDLCGVRPPAEATIDGRSLVPLLKDGGESWPDRKIYTHYERPADPSSLYPGAVRSQRWKMVNGTELYDLESDPGEKENLAAANPAVLNSLKDDYESWFRSVTTPRSFARPPIPVGYMDDENPARLSAPQARLTDGAKFHNEAGFAHDWIEGLGAAAWEVDSIAVGQYELILKCLTTGGPATITAGGQDFTLDLEESPNRRPIPLPDVVARREAAEMPWTNHIFGVARLPAGKQTITVRGQGLEVKELMLRRLN